MRTCIAFLLLVACCYQTSADSSVTPIPASDAKNAGTRQPCPTHPPDVNIIILRRECEVKPEQDRHEPPEHSKCHQKPKEEGREPPEQKEDQHQPKGDEQGEDQQRLKEDGQKITGENIHQQSESSNTTTTMAPVEDVTSSLIHQEPTRIQNETTKGNRTHPEDPPETTVITILTTTQEPTTVTTQEPTTVTTQEPTTVTTQEPTTVTTEDPNWCRKNGFMKPWPECKKAVEDDTQKLAEGLTKFSLELFHQILGKDRDTNVVFSPLSVAMVLSHLLLGAHGYTKELLMDTLFDANNLNNSDCIHTNLRNLNISQSMDSASGMFYRKDLALNDFFLDDSERFYKIRPVELTSDTQENLNKVNKWVEDKTHGRVKKILNTLPDDVRLVLLNAIFFKGKWETTFDVSETKKEKFFMKKSSKVMMMTSKKYPLVSVTDGILKGRIGRFPLSQNMSMLIFLPQFIQSPLSDLEKLLSYDIFRAIVNKLDRTQVKPTMVSLPRFKVDSTLDLLNVFSKSSLSDLFYDANLCGISTSEELLVSSGLHRAVLKMDESGVVAAAASAVTLARTMFIFEVRQPFLFVVWSDQGKFPVVMGRVNDPST